MSELPSAYVHGVSAYLPGEPVTNDDLEQVLGTIPGKSDQLKTKILRNNGIVKRHYAIDPETGLATHNAAQLGAEAIRSLVGGLGLSLSDIDLLACGTSLPEHVTPGHASMVHGELASHPCEIVSTHGVCCAGLMAIKYAAMAVQTGSARVAVASGTERTSSLLRASHFTAELDARAAEDEENPYIGFNQAFLRYMLSDGAGAMLLRPSPRIGGLSLKVHWIDLVSFAHELPTCMYMGARPTEDGGLQSWRDTPSLEHSVREGYFNLHQDVKLLAEHIMDVATRRTLELLRKKHDFTPNDIDWLVPHYSSEFFRAKGYEAMERYGFPIPYSKWWSTLTERGNTGCASIFIMLSDLMESGQVEPGQKVALMVPESGRFSAGWALLEAVAA
jgi:3-oxoacyl-[acyl-carrier-protein] synthase-3